MTKNVVCSSDGNSGDLSKYVVPGTGIVIQILKQVQESQWKLLEYSKSADW